MGRRPYPMGVLRAALARARTFAGSRQGIIAVGIGYKHSRTKGYGGPCVKFLVAEKADPPSDFEMIRGHLDVVYRGVRYRVATDVEVAGRPVQQNISPCFVAFGTTKGAKGTPGFLVASSNGQRYLITAGHVLFDKQPANPWNFQPVPVFLDTQPVGSVEVNHTYYLRAGARVDVGLVKLGAAPILQQEPWQSMQSIAQGAGLSGLFNGPAGPTLARMHGWKDTRHVVLDTLKESAVAFPGLVEPYAPKLVRSRAQDGNFGAGNSGAPIVIPGKGTLVGIHVLGDLDQPWVGWSIAAESIVSDLAGRLGTSLKLATP